ncbi:MAG: type II secretion system protein E [Nitrosopumilaceae archaeon]|nr:type II/IV secretion system ATPase subunit [Nitrosopumilaceae archaeon]NIU00048.1 type II/IV secretion system ATPase subunit [Nitrosopumilaceae archaeon]NIU86427.1 type II secretion system protein E [Nitrosopumilaceae archaeon]NIV65136.1 type II secretion system protein E [Nitrosopumilaceae archaeon]NIX60650.1 type II secretion system protein E [Nitrosopumilaceae archaeon]
MKLPKLLSTRPSKEKQIKDQKTSKEKTLEKKASQKPTTSVKQKPKSIQLKQKESFLNKLNSLFSNSSSSPKHSIVRFELNNLEVQNIDDYEIKKSYAVGPSTVYIASDHTGKLFYLVSEPPVNKVAKTIYPKLMNYLFVSLAYEISEEERKDVKSFAKNKILEISKELGLLRYTTKLVDLLQYYVVRDSFGYGIIDVLMNDPNIEDIVEESFSKPVGIAHRDFGEYGILDTNIRFESLDYANSFIQKLVQKTGKSMTAAVPYIDSMTREGHRLAATFGTEVSLPGPNFTIRKFSEEPYTITRLLQFGTINPLMAAYLWLLLESKAFVLVTGATSAGKTTTIGALSSLINPQMKITTIEDTAELKIGHTHWQRLLTRKSSNIFEDKYEVTMDDLIRLSLRSRPDYIVVGEVRGKEISSLIQAVSTGHGGLTSFHASDAKSAFVRMESPPMNVHVGGQMLISAILQQNRMVDVNGKILRRVTAINEIIPGKEIELKKIFEWDATSSRFMPIDVHEVVERSYRLQEIAKINGWTFQELINQIVTRMCFLSKLLFEQKTKFDVVTDEIEKFYYDPVKRHNVVLEARAMDDYGSIKF